MIFAPTSPDKIRREQLYEAERLRLEHAAAAEHHKALADMFLARVTRLRVEIAQPAETES